MNIQKGGFRINDDTDPNFILPRIRAILAPLERAGNDIVFRNEIIERFKQCYDVLLEFYSDNSFYYQRIIRAGQADFISNVPLRKYHINYSALILLSFLTELQQYYLLYKGIDPVNIGGQNEKRPIQINNITNPNRNNLRMYCSHQVQQS